MHKTAIAAFIWQHARKRSLELKLGKAPLCEGMEDRDMKPAESPQGD